MKASSRVRNLPTPSVQRLPVYLRFLKEARRRGDDVVSCTRIAEEFGQRSVQVRKDLAITGVSGRPKVGYRVDELIEAIESFLGWDVKTTAFLVGVGNLGRALLNYEGFVEHGLDVAAAFDANPALFGQEINGRVVRPLDQIASTAARLREEGRIVEMGIVTVPARAAQPVADKLVGIGVRAIWNYAPVRLDLPNDVVYEEVKLSASFAVLTNRLRRRDADE
ncbi:MAG: redox-sensing transcriptional repressor Rex [Thermoguttaceae bacterium]|nr:redox-sensing transcriptional repressor Rex [Thermoguttaceae bacterium]